MPAPRPAPQPQPPRPAPTPPTTAEPAPPAAAEPRAGERERSAVDVIAALRTVRTAPPESAEAAVTAVEAFPAGWPRRRAIVALIHAGVGGCALHRRLVGLLDAPGDRLFALAAAAAVVSDAADGEALLELARTPAERRRIAGRLAAHGIAAGR